jgi:protein-disulfide isomerase
MSKREVLREKRRKSQQRQQILMISGIVVVALVVFVILILPSLQSAAAPIGAFATIVPYPRPGADGLNMGNLKAPVKVEEFADFQCPGCRNFFESGEKSIVETYVKTGKVYYVYVPLSFIDDNSRTPSVESKHAAMAAYCASDQNRFWDYHDMLFTNQSRTGENVGGFSDKRLTAFAQTLGLDMNAFNSCFTSGKYQKQIQDDATYGVQSKVDQTPSFLVNGKLVLPQDLIATIEAALKAVPGN